MNFNIEPDEFIQILHNGHGHWMAIQQLEPLIVLYMCMTACTHQLVRL